MFIGQKASLYWLLFLHLMKILLNFDIEIILLMNKSDQNKTKEELIQELQKLRSKNDELTKRIFELQPIGTQDKSKLTKNRNLFHSIFEEAGIGMAIINRESQIVKFNKVFLNHFGYSKDEIYQMSYIDIIPKEKQESAKTIIESIFSSKINKYSGIQSYLKKDKSMVWVKLTATVVHDEFGIPEYIIGMGEDVSDTIKYEDELKKAKEKAEESDRLKTSFLTNMSHEIRTPMNAIIGFAELMAEPNLDMDSRREFIEQIYNSSKMLTKLIDDIIDISKIDAGDVSTRIKKFNVIRIFDKLRDKSIKELDVQKNIEILVHSPFNELPAFIETDEFRFRQIFEHLLSNAIKYTDRGFIEFGFDIDQFDIPTFYIRDTGIGIPEDKTEFIFKHFTKLEDRTKLYRGTGIGLTITQKLVNLLGGKIWVESNPGIGSIFYFTLPSKIEILDIPIKKEKPEHKNYNWIGKKILIAEDEDSNFLVLKAALSKTHASITRVTQGDQAVDQCKKEDYDIVLMDIKMPVLNGIDATKQIKEFKPDLPIIGQTAFVFKNERDLCMEAGCNEYISKPIKSHIILEMINKFFSNGSGNLQ